MELIVRKLECSFIDVSRVFIENFLLFSFKFLRKRHICVKFYSGGKKTQVKNQRKKQIILSQTTKDMHKRMFKRIP